MSEGKRHVNNKGRNDPFRGAKIAAFDRSQKDAWQKEYYKNTPALSRDKRQVMRRKLQIAAKRINAAAKLNALRDKARGQRRRPFAP
jgi:hypothetical protein